MIFMFGVLVYGIDLGSPSSAYGFNVGPLDGEGGLAVDWFDNEVHDPRFPESCPDRLATAVLHGRIKEVCGVDPQFEGWGFWPQHDEVLKYLGVEITWLGSDDRQRGTYVLAAHVERRAEFEPGPVGLARLAGGQCCGFGIETHRFNIDRAVRLLGLVDPDAGPAVAALEAGGLAPDAGLQPCWILGAGE